MARRRLEDELVRRGLVADRQEALELLSRGRVLVGGSLAANPAALVAEAEPVQLARDPLPFVSRGGVKLRAALDRFDIDPANMDCLDAGVSTGGFTDCLLKAGAARVIAVDVSYGQLAWSLRGDRRVTLLERTNVRALSRADIPFAPALVVADLSFISLGSVIPSLSALTAPEARFVVLVKPQFEAGRSAVGQGGVVADPDVWRTVLGSIRDAFERAGFAPDGVMASPIRGAKGNVEFLMTAGPGSKGWGEIEIGAAIAEGLEVAS
jgi:23S rRNA (cytidine1920-2'-O)/16S rRNA (cytidine1409-2'-O)-methyltransferase